MRNPLLFNETRPLAGRENGRHCQKNSCSTGMIPALQLLWSFAESGASLVGVPWIYPKRLNRVGGLTRDGSAGTLGRSFSRRPTLRVGVLSFRTPVVHTLCQVTAMPLSKLRFPNNQPKH